LVADFYLDFQVAFVIKLQLSIHLDMCASLHYGQHLTKTLISAISYIFSFINCLRQSSIAICFCWTKGCIF